MSDKILITSVLICFVESGFVPGWLIVILVIRDTLVSIVRILASESSDHSCKHVWEDQDSLANGANDRIVLGAA